MIKVTKVNPVALATPERGLIEFRVEMEGIGAHWLSFVIIKTAAGWQALDSEKRDTGICDPDLHRLESLIREHIEFLNVDKRVIV